MNTAFTVGDHHAHNDYYVKSTEKIEPYKSFIVINNSINSHRENENDYTCFLANSYSLSVTLETFKNTTFEHNSET